MSQELQTKVSCETLSFVTKCMKDKLVLKINNPGKEQMKQVNTIR